MVRIFATLILVGWSAIAVAMRDPTEPINCQHSANNSCYGRLTLSSVMVTPSHKLAIIDGYNYGENDWVGNKKIESIEPGKVVLLGEEGRTVLLVNKGAHQRVSITKH